MGALATHALPVVACTDCGERVMRLYTVEHRLVVLDATSVSGGLYSVDLHNRARRNTLVELYRAERAGAPLSGHDPHECTPTAWFDR